MVSPTKSIDPRLVPSNKFRLISSKSVITRVRGTRIVTIKFDDNLLRPGPGNEMQQRRTVLNEALNYFAETPRFIKNYKVTSNSLLVSIMGLVRAEDKAVTLAVLGWINPAIKLAHSSLNKAAKVFAKGKDVENVKRRAKFAENEKDAKAKAPKDATRDAEIKKHISEIPKYKNKPNTKKSRDFFYALQSDLRHAERADVLKILKFFKSEGMLGEDHINNWLPAPTEQELSPFLAYMKNDPDASDDAWAVYLKDTMKKFKYSAAFKAKVKGIVAYIEKQFGE